MVRLIDPHLLGLEVVKVSSTEVFCRCPFHADSTPSASFNMEKGVFHCFGCGTAKNARQLALELGGEIEYVFSVSGPKAGREEEELWRSLLLSPLAKGNPYLASRDVSPKTIARFGILEYSQGVIFPITDIAGKITGIQVRRYSGMPKYLFFGRRQPLWPMQETLKAIKRNVVLVEGVFGKLRAYEAGVEDCFATMSVSAVENIPRLFNPKTTFTMFDEDDAGILGSLKMLRRGYAAAWPMLEADELGFGEWGHFYDNLPERTTTDIKQLVAASSNPRKTWLTFHKLTRQKRGNDV